MNEIKKMRSLSQIQVTICGLYTLHSLSLTHNEQSTYFSSQVPVRHNKKANSRSTCRIKITEYIHCGHCISTWKIHTEIPLEYHVLTGIPIASP